MKKSEILKKHLEKEGIKNILKIYKDKEEDYKYKVEFKSSINNKQSKEINNYLVLTKREKIELFEKTFYEKLQYGEINLDNAIIELEDKNGIKAKIILDFDSTDIATFLGSSDGEEKYNDYYIYKI